MAENRHTEYDLAQMQSLPLSAKIRMTERRIIDWYDYWDGNVYVSISGGKDSQVLAHLIDNLTDRGFIGKVPKVFVNTGLEFDSVRLNGFDMADDVLRPKMSFVEVITKYGYPVIGKEVADSVGQVQRWMKSGKAEKTSILRLQKLRGEALKPDGSKSVYNQEKYGFLLDAPFRISSRCCNVMKKSPAHSYAKKHNLKPYIGTLAEESRLRRQQWIRNGCNGFDMKSPVSNPLSFWTNQDILKYIFNNKIKLADAYGDVVFEKGTPLFYTEDYMPTLTTTGVSRTGCVFCMFGITMDTDRFVKLHELEPKKFDYVMRGGCFDDEGMWIPGNDKNGVFGLGYKFVIDWLNEHGNLGIKY